ncbi:hypothetical protein [Streptomyces cyaneofuscatus]|uniref:hypothetical protein n=1 Tax=Streptomyces cyaneofuscatus TaxID=66883 RepID=UPI0033AB7E23
MAWGIEATAFHPLAEEVWEGMAAGVRSLVGFLAGREPEDYRRYGHWWSRLPDATVRVLPGAGRSGNPGNECSTAL